LSAGAIATPQLLMLSGIGDPQTFTKLDINPIVNLSDVGRNLQDHPLFTLQWSVNSTDTFDNVAFNQTAFAEAFQLYAANKTGIFANNAIANHIGFLRLAADSAALKPGDPSAGPSSPHYEFAFSVRCFDLDDNSDV
jgi:choline dehydrogenase-like flavoprotein